MKRFILILISGILGTITLANSPVNVGLNFRLNMPSATYESNDWGQFYTDLSNSYTITSVNDIIEQSDLGYAGGLFLRINKEKLFFHTEAMFSFNTTGVSYQVEPNISLETQTFSYSINSRHFMTPAFLGLNFVNTNAFKMRLFTGPTFSWLLDATATSTIDEDPLDNIQTELEFNEFTWLWTIGAGFELFMLSFDVRYGFSLSEVQNVAQLEESFNQSTNLLEFTLGFKLF